MEKKLKGLIDSNGLIKLNDGDVDLNKNNTFLKKLHDENIIFPKD